jgi:hypothetical protein
LLDSIVDHGRSQAHDEHHDWIGIRRGVRPILWEND